MNLGHENRGSLYAIAHRWHRRCVTELRMLRREAGLTQRGFASLLEVPLNSFRMWDSGLRSTPPRVMERARARLARSAHASVLVSLRALAVELGVHVQTLQRAVRTGRLPATFSTRSAFGRPMRLATRAAAAHFIAVHYQRRTAAGLVGVTMLPAVPVDYDQQLRLLRCRLHLSQAAFAARVGAANKAVVYQWASRQRTPSAVFWQRVQELDRGIEPERVA